MEQNLNKVLTKKCSECQDDIQINAKKCKNCGADLRNWFIRHKIITGILILYIVGVIVGTMDNKNNKQTENGMPIKNTNEVSLSKNSPAYNLASLQSFDSLGQAVPSQELIDKFEARLNSLTSKCPERNPVSISDLIVFSQQKLKEGGAYLNLLQIATGIDESISNEISGSIKCSEIAAAFVLLTISN